MLQLISGKLFQSEPGRINALRGVLYTNLHIAKEDTIETAGGKLLAVDSTKYTRALVYEVLERMEEGGMRVGTVVSHGIEPYLEEFAAIVSFALNVTCTPDPNLTARLTSGKPGLATFAAPSKLIRRAFDEQIWCTVDDTENLKKFVENLIGLKRKYYLGVMRAIKTFVTGMHRMADDLDLAYTLFVASIESLAQDFDGHTSTWADFDERKKREIDDALRGTAPKIANRVRQTLLDQEHASLTRRFRDFTLDHLEPSFFRNAAIGLENPVAEADLPVSLNQAYHLRSKYVHNLKRLPDMLTWGPGSDVILVDKMPTLTFQGITRVARQVIFEFVARMPKVEKEVYDYHSERPGIIQARAAPQHWIWQTDGFSEDQGPSRLEGFMQLICQTYVSGRSIMPDLTPLLEFVETKFGQMKAANRRSFLAIYLMFNRVFLLEVLPNFAMIVAKYKKEFERPSMEWLLCALVLGGGEWPLEVRHKLLESYLQQRFRTSGVRLNAQFEVGLGLDVAERYRLTGDLINTKIWISKAVSFLPGHPGLLALENDGLLDNPIDWRRLVFPASDAKLN